MARTTMTQPGVYFSLNAPFLKDHRPLFQYAGRDRRRGVIADHGVIGQAQKQFLIAQLVQARTDAAGGFQGAVVLAVQHPPFTMSKDHNPSPDMLADIDDACNQTGFMPDMIVSGHTHLYERYTRYFNGRQVQFVVAGCGGYPCMTGLKKQFGPPLRPPVNSQDEKGNRVVLENYFDQNFGFLRLSVSKDVLSCEFVGVSDPASPGKALDRFTLDLHQHGLTGFRRF